MLTAHDIAIVLLDLGIPLGFVLRLCQSVNKKAK